MHNQYHPIPSGSSCTSGRIQMRGGTQRPHHLDQGKRLRRGKTNASTFLASILLLVFVHDKSDTATFAYEIASSSISSLGASSRIIDGFETKETRYPYAVSLSYFGEHFCGGALIAPDVVITAGHCNGAGLPIADSSYSVVVGRHDISPFSSNNNNNDSAGEVLSVMKEIQHPEYNPDTVDNDFNLIILSEAVSTQTTYLRVNSDNTIPYSGAPLTVVGWGDTNADVDITTTSNVLLGAVVYTVSNEVCEQSSGFVDAAATGWEGGQQQHQQVLTGFQGGITQNMMCAKGDGTDACQVSETIIYIWYHLLRSVVFRLLLITSLLLTAGLFVSYFLSCPFVKKGDSGGPLIQRGGDSTGAEDLLMGIVSWGLGCADESFPGGTCTLDIRC